MKYAKFSRLPLPKSTRSTPSTAYGFSLHYSDHILCRNPHPTPLFPATTMKYPAILTDPLTTSSVSVACTHTHRTATLLTATVPTALFREKVRTTTPPAHCRPVYPHKSISSISSQVADSHEIHSYPDGLVPRLPRRCDLYQCAYFTSIASCCHHTATISQPPQSHSHH